MRAPRQLGRYRIERPLGSGGMGVVYLARADGGLPVALKSVATGFDAEAFARFKREAKLLAKLSHPGVCGVIQLVEHGPGAPFLVLEYVPGRTLEDLARNDLTVEQAVDLMLQVCDALAHAHAATVLHRDLKPSNVIVTPDDRAVVLDFGLARRVGDAETQAFSRSGDILGTPGFMPPEQALGEEITPQADVYGLGATLYAALTGEPPFLRRSTLATLSAVVDDPPVPPSRLRADVPPALDAICLRALAKDPRARFPTAAALGEALQAWRATAGATPARRPRAALIVGAALLALVAAVAAWTLRRNAAPDPSPAGTPTTPVASITTSSSDPPAPKRRASLSELEPTLRKWEAFAEAFARQPFVREAKGRREVAARFKQRSRAAKLWLDAQTAAHAGQAEIWAAGARLELAFNDYNAAVVRARKALELEPAHGPARLLLARALWRRALWEFLNSWIDPALKTKWTFEASRLLDEAAQLGVPILPVDRAWQATFTLLTRSRDRPRDPRVLNPLRRRHEASLRGLSGPEPLVLEALVLMVLDRRLLETFRLVDQALGIAPSSVSIRRLRGQLRARSDDPNSADDLRFILELESNGFDLLLLSEVYLDWLQPSRVDEILSTLDTATAATAVVSLIRSALAQHRDQYAAAARHLRVARERGVPRPLHPNVSLLTAELALHDGDYRRCREQLVKSSRPRGPYRKIALYTWARYYHAHSRFQEALSAIDAHRKRRPSPKALLVRGRILSDLGRHSEAIRSHQAAVRHGQGHARFQCWLGMAQVDADQVDAARSTYRALARAHPRSLYATTLAAYIAIARKSGPLARRACDAAIAVGGDRSETWIAHLLRGRLRAQSNDFAGGIQDLAKSLELQAGQPNALELKAELDRWRKEHP